MTHPKYWALASPQVLNHLGVTTKKRLDQGHLHPKPEVPRSTCPGRESHQGLRGGRRALWKRAIQTAYYFAIRNLYNTFIGHCAPIEPEIFSLKQNQEMYNSFVALGLHSNVSLHYTSKHVMPLALIVNNLITPLYRIFANFSEI